MVKFVFQSGGDRREIVHAETVEAAFEAARAMGLEDPVLLGDELGLGPLLEPGHPGEAVSAKHKYEGADGSKLDVVLFTLRSYPVWLWILSFASTAFLAYRLYTGADLAFFDAMIAVGAASPLIGVAYVVLNLGPGRHYNAYHLAMAYRDWPAAEKARKKLEGTLDPFQLESMRARWLAAQGHREKALAVLHPFAEDPRVDRIAYLTHIGMVCQQARDWDGSIATNEEMLKAGGPRARLLLDNAMMEIFRGNIAKARELYDAAKDEPLEKNVEFARPEVEGMILLEEGRHRDAIPLLEGALSSVEKQAINPIFLGPIALISLYLSLAHASQRDFDAARRLYERALPLMEHKGFDGLLDRCRAAFDAS